MDRRDRAETWLDDLRRALGPGSVRSGEAAPDARVDGLEALAVVEPADEASVAQVMAFAHERGLCVHVRGTGGEEEMGEPLKALDLVLSVRRLAGVVEHRPEDLTLAAWAGTPLDALERSLTVRGQRLPLRPVAVSASLGGAVATGRSGPLRLGHGPVRDAVLGVGLCLADGTLVRAGGQTVKNVAGYDLTRLIVGSLGTLGVITRVVVRLRPLPPAHRSVWLPVGDAADAFALHRAFVDAALEPVALEYLDGGAARQVGVGDAPGLAVAFEDEPEAVDEQADAALERHRSGGARRLDDARARGLWDALHTLGARAPLLVRLSAPPTALPALWRAAFSDAHAAALAPAGSASLAVGVARLWLAPADASTVEPWLVACRERAEAAGGALVLERAPTALRRRVGAFGSPPSTLARMRAVKAAFDPGGVLAPGRMVGGL